MKGVVFNLLETVVTRHHGAEVWDDLLDAAGLDGSYTSLGNYDDEEIEALVEAASKALGIDRAAVLRWFGRNAIPVLNELYPDFFAPHVSARPFVQGVNDIIHAEVRKLYTGASCPHFMIRENDDGSLSMDYRSARKMCALAQGFVEGAADFYGETVEFEHAACVEHGHPKCEFRIAWVESAKRVAA